MYLIEPLLSFFSVSCIDLQRLGWYIHPPADPVCRCMTHCQDGNCCKPPSADSVPSVNTFLVLEDKFSTTKYVPLLPKYFSLCKGGFCISGWDLYQMYLRCVLCNICVPQSSHYHWNDNYFFLSFSTCLAQKRCYFLKNRNLFFTHSAVLHRLAAHGHRGSRDGNRKSWDSLVSVKLLHNPVTVTEKWKMDKSFSCGKQLLMQLSTPNPCVNLVSIMGYDCMCVGRGPLSACVCVYASANAFCWRPCVYVCATTLIFAALMPSISCAVTLNNESFTQNRWNWSFWIRVFRTQ